MIYKFLFLMTAIFSSNAALFAFEPIEWDHHQEKYTLGSYIEILEDKGASLTFDTIIAPDMQHNWVPSQTPTPSFGYTKSAYWARFKIQNKEDFDNKSILEIAYPLLDSIELYFVEDGHLKNSQKSGDLVPFQQRNNKYRTFVYEINAKNQTSVYIRFRSDGPMKFPMTLWTPKAFFDYIKIEFAIWGFYFGFLIAMVLYNLFIYFSLRDKNYLYYVLYISSAILAQLTLHGFASFIFSNSPLMINHSLPILLNIDFLFGTIFCIKFLDTKNNTPKTHQALMVLCLAIFLSIFLIFIFGYSIAMKVSMLFLITIPIIVFLAAINAYLAGIKRARFFLIAWIPLLLSLIFISLDSMGVIKSSFFTYHSVEIGTALEVLILSLALADRFNIIKKEREAALEQQLTQTQKLASLGMTLQKFVPGEFLKCLNKGDITNIKLGDNIQKNMTVLFSDIRSFTQLSEKMTPEDNFNYLNSYLKRISPIIRKNGGFVDKYIGDSIMALFADSADDALRAAIAMKSELGLYNEERIQTGRAPVNTGIGIHSGSLMLGMIGEEERMDGTVISDAVNLASRIEGLTKRYDAHILISIDTFSSISHLADLKYRTIDYIKVQGREKSVAVMEILNGDISDSTLKKIETISDFERGMNSLVMEDFENAILYIQKVIDHNPSDVAARLILERARDFLKNGKPEGWDGSISINTK